MPCFFNGVLSTSYLQHFHQTAFTTALATETINLSFVAPVHLRMEQFLAHWATVPTNSELIELKKISGIDARINTVLRAVDPSSAGESLTDLSCVIPFYWDKGDTVQITYANTDDQDVGVEIFLVEVSP